MAGKTLRSEGQLRLFEDAMGVGIYLEAPDGTAGPQVAMVLTENLTGGTDEQAWADAQLLAAAPDLLGACKHVAMFLNRKTPLPPAGMESLVKHLMNAINLATVPSERRLCKPPLPPEKKHV